MKIDFYSPAASEREMNLPLYLATIGTSAEERRVYRPDGIETYQLLYTEEGCGEVILPKMVVRAEQESIVLLPPHTQHNYYMTEGVWRTAWITYGGKAADAILDFGAGIWSLPENFDFMEKFNEIKSYAEGEEWANRRSSLLYELLLECRDCMGSGGSLVRQKDRLREAIAFMEKRFDENIGLWQMAEISGMSREHFCRLFKNYMGESPISYVKKLRIRRAKELLVSKRSMKISEVGERSGFQSGSYFSRVFRETEGCTPEEYRLQTTGKLNS